MEGQGVQPPAVGDSPATGDASAVEFNTETIVPCWDVGQVIWAKLEGYPWWPSQVEPRESDFFDLLPSQITDETKLGNPQMNIDDKPKDSISVFFFGENNWGWVPRNAVLPFDDPRYPNICAALSRVRYVLSSASDQAQPPSPAPPMFAKALKAGKVEYNKRVKTPHGETCWHCNEGGQLLCCDLCPAEYCFRCLGIPPNARLSGDWSCAKCYTLTQQVCNDQLQLLVLKESHKLCSFVVEKVSQNLAEGRYSTYRAFESALLESLAKSDVTPEEEAVLKKLRTYAEELAADYRKRFPPYTYTQESHAAPKLEESPFDEFSWHEAEVPAAIDTGKEKDKEERAELEYEDGDWQSIEDSADDGGEEDIEEFTPSASGKRNRGQPGRKGKSSKTANGKTAAAKPTPNAPPSVPSSTRPPPTAPPPRATPEAAKAAAFASSFLGQQNKPQGPRAGWTPQAPPPSSQGYQGEWAAPPNLFARTPGPVTPDTVLALLLSNSSLRKQLEQMSDELKLLENKMNVLGAKMAGWRSNSRQ